MPVPLELMLFLPCVFEKSAVGSAGMLLEDLLEFLERGLGEDATGRSRGSRSWAQA